jgi:hypothetical protein
MKIKAYGIGSERNDLDECSVTFPEALTTDLRRINKLMNYLEDRVDRRPPLKCWESSHETYFIHNVTVEVPDVLPTSRS